MCPPTAPRRKNPKGGTSCLAYERFQPAAALPCSSRERTSQSEVTVHLAWRRRLPCGAHTNRAQGKCGKGTEEHRCLFSAPAETRAHRPERRKKQTKPNKAKNSCGRGLRARRQPKGRELLEREARLVPRKR